MKILGIAAPFGHNSSAALIVDGRIIAAKDPSRVYKKFFRNKKELNNQTAFVNSTLEKVGFDLSGTKVEQVEHHLAHIASSFYLPDFDDSVVMSIDGGGEITATLLGSAKDKEINVVKEIVAPDSLGNFYSTMTDYLGFRRENGEYKVMGMAPYGDPNNISFDHILSWDDYKKTYRCADDYVWVRRKKRFRVDKVYSKKMVEEFGPERQGDGLSEPYIYIAAVTQRKPEEMVLRLTETYLKDILEKNGGSLCIAGGCALNVALNRVLLEQPYINRLWVQPAAHDAGTFLGVAVWISAQLGEKIESMRHTYLGPEFNDNEILATLEKYDFSYQRENNIACRVSELLINGEVVGWFQGRMEWGPRALGNRSILGNPTIKGTDDKINIQIKFREKWRPFCPSILAEHASEILDSTHPAPFMTIAFKVNPEWRQRIPEVVHVNGTCRPQTVEKEISPKFHEVIENFYKRTGYRL